jgi:hypothetical protein
MNSGSTEGISAYHKLKWDYRGWEKYHSNNIGVSQRDWNQTLITQVNAIATHIYMASTRSGDTIKINRDSSILSILQDSEFYHQGIDKSFIGKYNIVFDDSLPLDKIYITNGDYNIEVVAVIEYKQTLDEIGEHIIRIFKLGSEEIEKFRNIPGFRIVTPDMVVGEITVFNNK